MTSKPSKVTRDQQVKARKVGMKLAPHLREAKDKGVPLTATQERILAKMERLDETVRIGFAKQPFMQTIGAQLASVGSGKCEILLPFDVKLTQQHGFFHGGVISTIADNAAGFAAYSLMPEGRQPLSIEFKVSLLSVATGKPLIARAEVLKAGRKIFHVRSDVLIVEEDDEVLVATALATIKCSKSVKEV